MSGVHLSDTNMRWQQAYNNVLPQPLVKHEVFSSSDSHEQKAVSFAPNLFGRKFLLSVKEVRWVTVLHDRTRWNWTRLAMQCNAMQHICICVSVYLRICVFVYFHDSHLWNWTLSCDATYLKNCNNFWFGHLFDLNTGSIFEEEIAFWIFADQRSSCCLSATSVCSLPPYPPRRSSSTQAALLGLVLYTGKSSTGSK